MCSWHQASRGRRSNGRGPGLGGAPVSIMTLPGSGRAGQGGHRRRHRMHLRVFGGYNACAGSVCARPIRRALSPPSPPRAAPTSRPSRPGVRPPHAFASSENLSRPRPATPCCGTADQGAGQCHLDRHGYEHRPRSAPDSPTSHGRPNGAARDRPGLQLTGWGIQVGRRLREHEPAELALYAVKPRSSSGPPHRTLRLRPSELHFLLDRQPIGSHGAAFAVRPQLDRLRIDGIVD